MTVSFVRPEDPPRSSLPPQGSGGTGMFLSPLRAAERRVGSSMVEDKLPGVNQRPQRIGERRAPIGRALQMALERFALPFVGQPGQRCKEQLVEHFLVA